MSVCNSVTIDPEVCTGCGVCIDTCPTDVLALEPTTRRAYPAYPQDCQACFLCVFDCAFDGAVSVSVTLGDDARELLERGQFAT